MILLQDSQGNLIYIPYTVQMTVEGCCDHNKQLIHECEECEK